METAGEGGAWGAAILASYMRYRKDGGSDNKRNDGTSEAAAEKVRSEEDACARQYRAHCTGAVAQEGKIKTDAYEGNKYASVFLFVRRKGMSKPPVKLGVDKSHLIEKERTS